MREDTRESKPEISQPLTFSSNAQGLHWRQVEARGWDVYPLSGRDTPTLHRKLEPGVEPGLKSRSSREGFLHH